MPLCFAYFPDCFFTAAEAAGTQFADFVFPECLISFHHFTSTHIFSLAKYRLSLSHEWSRWPSVYLHTQSGVFIVIIHASLKSAVDLYTARCDNFPFRSPSNLSSPIRICLAEANGTPGYNIPTLLNCSSKP